MVLTERRDPHDSQDMKNIRFSFVRRVSGDLQVLHVTYSTAKPQCDLSKNQKIKKPTDISTEDIFHLFRLETTLNN